MGLAKELELTKLGVTLPAAYYNIFSFSFVKTANGKELRFVLRCYPSHALYTSDKTPINNHSQEVCIEGQDAEDLYTEYSETGLTMARQYELIKQNNAFLSDAIDVM